MVMNHGRVLKICFSTSVCKCVVVFAQTVMLFMSMCESFYAVCRCVVLNNSVTAAATARDDDDAYDFC